MTSFFVCVCVFVSLVAYFHYTTPNIGVLYIYNNNNYLTQTLIIIIQWSCMKHETYVINSLL